MSDSRGASMLLLRCLPHLPATAAPPAVDHGAGRPVRTRPSARQASADIDRFAGLHFFNRTSLYMRPFH
jgi:hypothetical protein